jgi:hypothetical protein
MPWVVRDKRCGNLVGFIPGEAPMLAVESKEKRRAWARIPLVAMRATVEWADLPRPGAPDIRVKP